VNTDKGLAREVSEALRDKTDPDRVFANVCMLPVETGSLALPVLTSAT